VRSDRKTVQLQWARFKKGAFLPEADISGPLSTDGHGHAGFSGNGEAPPADDKDLVHEFVVAEGLTCLIKVGAEADQNYQNYILREKLYNSSGRDLRRALFSLKQIFQVPYQLMVMGMRVSLAMVKHLQRMTRIWCTNLWWLKV